ncbi:Hypothetical predicted protein [Podarcis lilfordi]|uniref:Uncharacterized protein n=1 Tax=Podarcis lilfordi TaxID=74358 RepID=A0AA35LCN8_9SAUR|nr:Hypothetical predicted protein [Podarcis lilfordi]
MEKKSSPKSPPKSPAETPAESLDEPSLPQPDPESTECPASVSSTAVESSAVLGQEEPRSQHPYPQLFGWGASSSSGRAPLPAPELSTADVIKPLLFCQPMAHVYPRVRGHAIRPSRCFTGSVSLPGQEKPALRLGSSRRRGISRSVSFMIDESPAPRESSTCRGNGQSASPPGRENPSLDEVSSTKGMGRKRAAAFSSLKSGSKKSVSSFEGISFESALQGTQAVSSTFKSPEGSVPAPSTADVAKGGQGQGQKKHAMVSRGRKPAMKFGKGATGTRIPVSGGQDNRSTSGSLMEGEGIRCRPGQAALAAQVRPEG